MYDTSPIHNHHKNIVAVIKSVTIQPITVIITAAVLCSVGLRHAMSSQAAMQSNIEDLQKEVADLKVDIAEYKSLINMFYTYAEEGDKKQKANIKSLKRQLVISRMTKRRA